MRGAGRRALDWLKEHPKAAFGLFMVYGWFILAVCVQFGWLYLPDVLSPDSMKGVLFLLYSCFIAGMLSLLALMNLAMAVYAVADAVRKIARYLFAPE